MHDTAMAAGEAFFSTYFEDARPRLLDVGALDLNGSLRAVAPPGCEYVGVDLEAGPGVDLVLEAGQPLPFAPESFDACVSVSCFEHDLMFWDTFRQMAEIVRLGGFIFLNAPSNGPYHRFPADNWRFYPDAGVALAAWARRQGQPLHLVESGILHRRDDVWNDFVAVFQKDLAPPARKHFLLDAFPDATNVRLSDPESIRNPDAATEDIALLQEARARAHELAVEKRALQASLVEERSASSQLRARLAEQEAELRSLRRKSDDLERTLRDKQDRLEAVEASNSWRMTAPLRAVRRRFGA